MSEKILKPQIRFKGFTDAWEQRELDALLTQRIEHQTISNIEPLLAFSYADGVIDPENKKSNKRDFLMVDKDNKVFSRAEINDIIYNPANVIHGAIHRNKLKNGVVSPIYKIFKCNEGVSPKFLGERLHTDNFINNISKYIEGTVIKLRTLAPEQFLKMSIKISNKYEEQEKIGIVFEQLDNLITLHQRKYEKLQTLKKALLEKMFPANNDDIPQIRFKGFTDAWEQRKLKELIRKPVSDGPHETPNLLKEGIPFISVEAIHDGIIDLDKCRGFISEEKNEEYKKKYNPEKGDVLFTKAATIGRVAVINDTNFNVWSPIGAIKPNFNLTSSRYLFQILQTDKIKKDSIINSNNGSQLNLSMDKIEDFNISKPYSINEQNKIAIFLDELDHLITLHQRKCEKLKNMKKALLDKMFC